MAPAIDGNMLYAVTQNACGEMTPGPYTYKGETVSGFLYLGDPSAEQNASLYAVNLSTGKAVWHDNLPNRYQGSSTVVSGGVIYAVDRAGILYEFNQQTGKEINSYGLNGVGAAGVAIGEDGAGNMMVFAPAGGGSDPEPTSGVLVAYWLGQTTTTGSTSGVATSTGTSLGGLEQPIIIVLGVAVVVLAMYVLVRRRAPQRPAAGTQ